MNEGTRLEMKVDMNIIQHLGISMYATLPPVIAELVSNAWDADAGEVWIELYDSDPENKKIVVRDNGVGMSFKEIQDSFLVIGKNRRKKGDATPKGRKVIGRKGIGKLSMFGIANEIVVTSIKEIDGRKVKNRFWLDLNDIKNAGTVYYPPHDPPDQETDEPSGTIIEIKKIRRKSSFDPEKIAIDLARRFLIFDENFRVFIKYNNEEPFEIKQDMRFKGIDIEFEWEFPNSGVDSSYEHKEKVKGKVFAASKPVPEDMKGIYLVARGKLVHRNDFYGIRSSDYAHAYLTGWLEVDFIDEDPEEDNISTNRQELIWENEDMHKLRDHIQKIITFVTRDWREKRRSKKEKIIKEQTGINIPEWINSLDPISKPIAKKLVSSVLSSESLPEEKATDMIQFIYEMFEFESFRELAARLIEENDMDEKILDLMKKWEIVEAREMYKLSRVRIDTIRNFKKLIEENAREVPIMHNFFKKFPWLLDPRIMEFRDEVRFSELLKENFPEEELEGKDRRIDFLCTRLGGILFIIELKRPGHTLKLEDIEQAKRYRTFIEKYIGNEINEKVIAYVVVGKIPKNSDVQDEIDTLKTAQKVYIRTYMELLQNAINYHDEFIKKYQELIKEQ